MRIFLRFFLICWMMNYQAWRCIGGMLKISITRLPSEEKEQRRKQLQAICLTDFFRSLGATFIKLGQIISTRPDILPPYIIAELEKLQDDVPSFPFSDVEKVINEELNRPMRHIFSRINEEPIAAASISQVHEAWLTTGQHVVVKVQRPDIEIKMKQDLRLIIFFANLAHKIPGISNIGINHLAEQFSTSLVSQLDFDDEVSNNLRFARNLKDLPWCRVPKIYRDYCSKRVITMEFAEGRKFTEILDNPPLDRYVMARRLFDIYLDMAFRDFFIHADLHPGNILVDDKGNFILIDTGLVYEVPRHYIRKFFRVGFSSLTFDGRLIGGAYLEDVDISDSAREAALEDIDAITKNYIGLDIHEIEAGQVLMETLNLLRKHKIYLDAELSGLILSDITFEGLAKQLAGDFDVIGYMTAKFPEYLLDQDLLDLDDPIVAAIMRTLVRDKMQEFAHRMQKRWLKPFMKLYLASMARQQKRKQRRANSMAGRIMRMARS